MRERKYKVWDKRNNRWADTKDIENDIIVNPCVIDSVFYIMDDSHTGHEWYDIVEYTGLKDKNGKEIYEGDILGAKDRWFKPIVGFRDGMFVVKNLSPYCRLHEYMKDENWIIIGNKYENPELLKDKVTVSEV